MVYDFDRLEPLCLLGFLSAHFLSRAAIFEPPKLGKKRAFLK
nr:MAG TPA: hypothetical protein [Caudoviricetes sp.]